MIKYSHKSIVKCITLKFLKRNIEKMYTFQVNKCYMLKPFLCIHTYIHT